jgi:hypothetical protein
METAKSLLAKIRRGDLLNPFKARDVYQKGWALLTEPEQVHKTADLLIEYGYLQSEHPRDGLSGRRPCCITSPEGDGAKALAELKALRASKAAGGTRHQSPTTSRGHSNTR